jgi:hypothetical protein
MEEAKEFPDFTASIIELQNYRQFALLAGDKTYPESELCYQLISLYMGLKDYMIEGKDYSKEYIDEKQFTVMRIVTGMIRDKLRPIATPEE